jgi:hypothetical protein
VGRFGLRLPTCQREGPALPRSCRISASSHSVRAASAFGSRALRLGTRCLRQRLWGGRRGGWSIRPSSCTVRFGAWAVRLRAGGQSPQDLDRSRRGSGPFAWERGPLAMGTWPVRREGGNPSPWVREPFVQGSGSFASRVGTFTFLLEAARASDLSKVSSAAASFFRAKLSSAYDQPCVTKPRWLHWTRNILREAT